MCNNCQLMYFKYDKIINLWKIRKKDKLYKNPEQDNVVLKSRQYNVENNVVIGQFDSLSVNLIKAHNATV